MDLWPGSSFEVVTLSRQARNPAESFTALSVDLSHGERISHTHDMLKAVIDGRPVAGLVDAAGGVKPLGTSLDQGTDLLRALCLMAVAVQPYD